MFYDQAKYEVRCEWGAKGIERLADGCDVIIVVDVLSFSTCVDVAVGRGAEILPYAGSREGVEAFAVTRGAMIAAAGRGESGRFTLSPSSLVGIEAGTRLVLPSPNGSTLSVMAGEKVTFAGCLRNAESVAEAAAKVGGSVLVVPAGERWEDGSVRFAVEDLIGAGAIISYLARHKSISPEAGAAVSAYKDALRDMYSALAGCSSGRELIERGFGEDVALAAEVGCSAVAPRLVEGAYRAG